MSSGGSKLALVVAGGFAIGTVFYVHMSQNSDRKRMKEGVKRDMERQARKKQNILLLEEQKKLKETLEKRYNK